MIKTLYFIQFWVFTCGAVAQIHIQGHIQDFETGVALPFCNVIVVPSYSGTVANAEGDFQIVVNTGDSIKFTHVGYETLSVSPAEMSDNQVIRLKESMINLNAIEITDRELTALEIIKRVKENYDKNHPEVHQTLELFYHRFENSAFPKTNSLQVEASDFVGLDVSTINNLLQYMPEEFVEYQDGFLKWHSYKKEYKVELQEGISLQEQSVNHLEDMVKGKLKEFFDDVKTTNKTGDQYYKFRTGILGMKLESPEDSLLKSLEKDSTLYPVSANDIKYSIANLLEHFTTIDGKNMEFLRETKSYQYGIPSLEVLNDELVYQIDFEPKEKGLFTGTMYVALSDYAILQVQMQFTKGKVSSEFSMLGFGHATNFKSARVIFERTTLGCFPKYLNVNIQETASIDRNFKVMKKEKRFLWDKTLNELKMTAELEFYPDNHWEILIQKRTPIDEEQFEAIEQQRMLMFKKAITADLNQLRNRTAITPTEELKKYIRTD